MDKEFYVNVELDSDDDKANESMPLDSSTVVVNDSTQSKHKQKLTSFVH